MHDRGDAVQKTSSHCSLEYDVIYSLLQLAKDADSYALEVDYSRPFEDVCRPLRMAS